MKWIVSACVSFIAVLLFLGGCWLSGFDFDQRGPAAGWCYIVGLVICAYAFIAVTTEWKK